MTPEAENARAIVRVATSESHRIGTLPIRRVLPQRGLDVGAFMFLDHMGPIVSPPGDPSSSPPRGTGPHPHRGFSTFTYVLEGEVKHRDSAGNEGVVAPGGVQWMFAGRGIIHDERPTDAHVARGGTLHGLQLWIDAPAARKEDAPAYRAFTGQDLPVSPLPNGSGTVRVLAGSLNGVDSPVPTLSPVLAAHVHLERGASVSLDVVLPRAALYGISGAVVVPAGAPSTVTAGTLGVLGESGTRLFAQASSEAPADFLLLASAPYDEPRVMDGPFVMSDFDGIARAYADYRRGAYGELE